MSGQHILISSDPLERDCLDLANRLIQLCKLPIRNVSSIRDINSGLISSLFESITKQKIPDLLHSEDSVTEAHNVQAVIDTLSLDLLGMSLSHITGEDVIAGSLLAIFNLLEIFEGVLLFLTSEREEAKTKKQGRNDRRNHLHFTETERRKRAESHVAMKDLFLDHEVNKENATDMLPTSVDIHLDKRSTEFLPHIDKTHREKESGPSKKPCRKRKVSKLIDDVALKQHKTEDIEELYEANFKNKIRSFVEGPGSVKHRVSQLKKTHLQAMGKTMKRTPIPPCHKSFLLPYNLRRKSVSRTSPRRQYVRMKCEKSAKKKNSLNRKEEEGDNLLQEVLQEFPGVKLPSNVLENMRKRYEYHLTNMHKQMKSCLLKKPKVELQADEAARRQSMIANILKKEVQQRQYLKEVNDRKIYENKMTYHLRDARLRTAKMKQYHEEFRLEMRKKLQKRNILEELIVENTFKEVLNIQKNEVNTLCKKVMEAGENDAKQHLQYLEALENLYQNEFSLLAESLATEKRDVQTRIKAQEGVSRAMKREIEDNLKREVRFMQRVILDTIQDTHFRELDAENYKERIQKQSAV